MTNGTLSAWTDELAQKALRLWDEKLSAVQIADKISEEDGVTFSRNAVIGKLHRLGATKREPSKDKPQAQRVRRHDPERVRASKVSGSTLPPLPFTPRIVEVTPLNLALLDLADGACRYACTPDDVPASELRFCGHPAINGMPYCASHAALCYHSPNARRNRPHWRTAA